MLKVSIVIPVYNVSNYIEGCILSVMKQTYPHIECIIVDDASPDDSIEKCERMITHYQGPIHFTILRQEHNKGQSAARNTGIDAMTGDYVYFLDSDDEITPNCIELLTRPLMEDSSIEVVQGNYVWLRKAGKKLKPAIYMPVKGSDYSTHEDARRCFYEDKIPYAWNKLISKSFIDKYQIRFMEGVMWEDLLWCLILAKHLRHLYLIPDVTYFYYRRPHSTTTGLKRAEKISHCAIIYNEIADNLTPDEGDMEVLLYLNQFCQHYLIARGDSRFNHPYSVFYKVLSDSGHYDAVKRLKRVRMINEHALSRWLFEIALKLYHLYQDVFY